MPMMVYKFRFPGRPGADRLRTRLRAEVGAWRGRTRNLDIEWHPDPVGATGVLGIYSMDPVALVYAAKLCVDLGGEHVPGRWSPPDWAKKRWVDLPWTKRLRLWIGPTKFRGDSA